jgi:hypothetical protein
MPSFYQEYSLEFLSNEGKKKLRITTNYGYKTYELRIKKDPLNAYKSNGVITLKAL